MNHDCHSCGILAVDTKEVHDLVPVEAGAVVGHL
jgi:hypothetical protein